MSDEIDKAVARLGKDAQEATDKMWAAQWLMCRVPTLRAELLAAEQRGAELAAASTGWLCPTCPGRRLAPPSTPTTEQRERAWELLDMCAQRHHDASWRVAVCDFLRTLTEGGK